ncbi:MAG: nitrate reductase cytochrome c-type subunit [Halioglobus sp.]
MKSRITITVLLGLALTAGALAQNVATTRDAALDVEPNPPKISRVENDDVKRKRAYPMQPPTVPHKIDNYQVDTNANKCMSCHSRRRTQESQAPMVSVTHYMDRDGNFLADISARRYFCNQCHVVQRDVVPLLDNEFEDIDELLRAARK